MMFMNNIYVGGFMKKLFLLVVLGAQLAWATDLGIGKEYITPLSYPKFSLGSSYSTTRYFHNFLDPKLRFNIEEMFSLHISFEAGLLPYFNAGAITSMGIPNTDKNIPMDVSLGLFAKPYFPLGDRLAIFSRIALGIAVVPMGNNDRLLANSSRDFMANYMNTYKGQEYMGWPLGGFASATLGIDYFPFSRLGLSLEYGIKAHIYRQGKENAVFNKKSDRQDRAAEPIGAPSSFTYMIYDAPLSLMLHIII